MKLMIIRYFFIASFCITLGCGMAKTERTVQDDNIFYSSYRPTIRIKINPDFKLEEKIDDQGSGFNEEFGEKSSNVKINNFFFKNRISGKPRAVIITIRELTTPKWFFKSNIFSVENQFDSGDIKIGGKKYQSCTYVVARPNGDLLIRGIGKIFGAEDNGMIVIQYLEQVTGNWSNIDLLTAEQQSQLNEFIEDSKKDIQILE